ncbi:hypothetical protein BC332_15860 [Capsicum chinense]|nr:hypothetical protein BC332_15860 [Capsicum chinense]
MVDDGSYSRFPWGKVAFEKLMASISLSMNEVRKFYRLSNLLYALQIWWYEYCTKFDESLAVHVHNLIPRMVNWKVVKPKPRYEDLMDDDMFSSSIDRSEPRVSLDKDKVVPNVEIRDADKASAAVEEKLSLSKSDLDEIKSYVRTYVDMKLNDLQKLMVDY